MDRKADTEDDNRGKERKRPVDSDDDQGVIEVGVREDTEIDWIEKPCVESPVIALAHKLPEPE
jgi:hypothetical protein